MHERVKGEKPKPVVRALVSGVKQKIPLVSGDSPQPFHEPQPEKDGPDIHEHGEIRGDSGSIAVPKPPPKNVKKAQDFPQDFAQSQNSLLRQQLPHFPERGY